MNALFELDRVELVLRMACLTEDRTPAERRALADMAFRVDQERNQLVVTNHRAGTEEASDLVGELDLAGELTAKQEATRRRRLAAWPAPKVFHET